MDLNGLMIKIGLDVDGLEKGTKKARQSINEIGKVATGAAMAFKAASVAIVASNLESIKEIENTARAAGLLTAEFQRGAYAASQFGIEQDKYGDILKDVNDKVGDFLTTGAGGMVDFFEQIAPKVGITADAFKGLNSQEALGLYISSLQKANVSQAEMTFYMEALASDSTRLVPLFEENGKALADLSQEAKDFGIGLSEIDVAKVELANKAIAKSSAFATGLGQTFTVEVAPILAAVTEKFNEMAKEAGGTSTVIRKGFDIATSVVGVFADGLHGVNIILKGLEVAARGAAVVFLKIWQGVTNTIDFLINDAIKDINYIIEKFNQFTNSSIEPLKFELDTSGLKWIPI